MSKVPEELTPLIRQYKRTCDDGIVMALHLGKTTEYVETLKAEASDKIKAQQKKIAALKLQNKALADYVDGGYGNVNVLLEYFAKRCPEEYMRHVTKDMLTAVNLDEESEK